MDTKTPTALAIPTRRDALQAQVSWGTRTVTVGGDAPVRLQSMTNTDTTDAIGTAIQVKPVGLEPVTVPFSVVGLADKLNTDPGR